MEKIRIPLRVNGEAREVLAPVHHTLLEVLREDLGLMGTKHGCELGECGTCTVLVGGRPVLSCLTLPVECDGEDVRTVEAMAQGGQLHPLQQAFVELGAAQCGYCTPGFLLVAEALLAANPKPTRQEIAEATAGNLCRCTGYLKIFEAIELAAARMRGETAPDAEALARAAEVIRADEPQATAFDPDRQGLGTATHGFADSETTKGHAKVIGEPLPKVDAAAKVTGQTLFADDLVLPRMVFAKLLRSPHPHARITRIDVSRAAAHPGVVATLVGSELPIPFGILPVSQDEHALAPDKVRFVGDPVAAVAALDEETAEEALKLIDVEYEVLPALMTIDEALARPDSRIHDYGPHGNVHKEVSFDFGDVEGGFAEADHVREDTFFFEGNTHLPMEQHAAVAAYGPDGKLTLWSSTQTPHYVHRALAKVLEMPPAHVRVIATPNGGGFGGKSDPFNHEVAVCKLAMKCGRPVKVTLTREEVFYCHRGRHPVKMWVKTGVKKDGSITAMHFRTALDGGGYGSYGVASLYYTGALQTVTYRVPRYKFEGVRVFTNKPPCGPKRGHGTPQPRFALECHIDKICADLGIDPAEWRLRNTVAPGTVTANQMKVRTIGLSTCFERVMERSGWRGKKGALGPGRGIGIAGSAYISGAGLPIYWNAMPHSGVQIKVDRGGGVTVFCGSTDIGQGSDSVLAYVVAEELGIRPEDIRVVTADTDLTPVDLGSYSSRVTLMTGNAAIQAARRVRAPLLAAAAKKLGVPVERLRAGGRRIWDAADESKSLRFAEAVVLAEGEYGTLGSVGSYRPPKSVAKWKGAGVGPTPTYSYSAAVVELSADRETGIIRVDKVWIAHDVGRSLNPMLVIGQVEGGVYMGLGEVLMEEQVFRKGLHRIPSLLDYKSPTTLEMPPVDQVLVETLDPEGPYGGKECGQGPLLPVIPAVANALRDALGVSIDEVPITPEKVLAALEGRYRGPQMPAFRYPETVVVEPLEVAAPAAFAQEQR